jgi:hypothetical protein
VIAKVMFHLRAAGGGDDATRQGRLVEEIENFHHAGLQRHAGLGELVEMGDGALAQPIGVVSLAEMGLQHLGAADPGVADHLLDDLQGQPFA